MLKYQTKELRKYLFIDLLIKDEYKFLRHIIFLISFFLFLFFARFWRWYSEPYSYFILLFVYFSLIGMAYFNIYVLVPYFFFKKYYLSYLSLLILLGVVGLNLIGNCFDIFFSDYRLNPEENEGGLYEGTLMCISIILISTTFKLLQKWTKDNERIVELSNLTMNMELKELRNQINPHFLYNILGTIRTCQALGKLDIADQMLTNLTAFYRLTLRKSKELIPIKDELEIARLYLEMEKLCHKDNLNWEINAEDGIENFTICKFTLQPFLENSILHGLSADTPEVFISIQVLYGDDTVVISIEDNGAGMSPETLEQLRYAIDNKVINYEKHFGISNVSARISNPLYGNGSVRIDSHPGNGTYVTIEFQQMEDTDEENNDCR